MLQTVGEIIFTTDSYYEPLVIMRPIIMGSSCEEALEIVHHHCRFLLQTGSENHFHQWYDLCVGGDDNATV